MLQPLDGALCADDIVRILEEKCGVGVFSLDLMSQEVTLSSGLGMMIGLAPGRNTYPLALLSQMIHPLDRVSTREAVAALERGGPVLRELRIITPQGHLRWLTVQGEFLLDGTGHASKVIGVGEDTSLHHHDDSRAAANRERLRHLVTGVAPILWAATAEGRLTEISGWQAVTGMADGKALGWDWLEGIHAAHRDAMLMQWYASIQQKAICDSEVCILQRDGNFRWFRVYGVPRFKKSGNLRDWTGMAIDVHEQRQNRHPDCGKMVTGAQIRASRGILRWSVEELRQASGVTAAVIRRLESNEGPSPKSRGAVEAVANALSQAGVEFTFDPGTLPGVRPS